MKLMRLTLILAILGFATSAHAIKLATAIVFASPSENMLCALSNVGTKDAKNVVVEGRNAPGLVVAPSSNSCGAVLPAGESCTVSFPNGVDVACTFSASGKIRGAAQILDSEGTTTMAIPATVK